MAPPKRERQKKRDLIRWDDDKDTQILLAIQAHSMKRGIKIPWDDVAQEIGPKVTGNAVIQHLAKLRKRREGNGLPVPGLGNRRKSLKRAVSEDSDDQIAEGGGGKSDDSYEGPAPKIARRRPSKVVKHDRVSSAGSARAKNTKVTPAAKPTGSKKEPVVKTEEDVSLEHLDQESSDEDSVGEELVAPGQPFLQLDNFEDGSEGDDESDNEDVQAAKEGPGVPKPSKIVTLQYNKGKHVAEQNQGEPNGEQVPLPSMQPAEQFESGWADPWAMHHAAQFHQAQFDPHHVARAYGYGQPHPMMQTMSFPPPFAPHGGYPPMMDHRMHYIQGAQEIAHHQQFTPASMPPMSFGAAATPYQYQSSSQPLPTLPPIDWDNSAETLARNMGGMHTIEGDVKPVQATDQSIREMSTDSSNDSSSSVASNDPNFEGHDVY